LLASTQIIVFLEKSKKKKKILKEIIFGKEKCKIFLKYFEPFCFLKWNLQNQLIIQQTRALKPPVYYGVHLSFTKKKKKKCHSIVMQKPSIEIWKFYHIFPHFWQLKTSKMT